MTDGGDPIIEFSGRVECRRDPSGPLGLTLVGQVSSKPDEIALLAFQGAPPPDMPAAVESATVQRAGIQAYRITAGGREWIVTASGVFLHSDAARSFYEAIPPRRVPALKRLLWRVALAVASTGAGRYWLARRRS
jgi:hypothetical protein